MLSFSLVAEALLGLIYHRPSDENFSFVVVPDYVTFLNQVTYSGNLVQTELPIERKPNQITRQPRFRTHADCRR